MNNAYAVQSNYYMDDYAYDAACDEAAFGEDYYMEFTVAATDLMEGDVIVAGHGYGESPQTVVRHGGFTTKTYMIQLLVADNHHRAYHCTPDARFTIQR